MIFKNYSLDTLTNILAKLDTCDNCKINGSRGKRTEFILYGTFTVCAIDGSSRWFSSIKRGSFSVVFGVDHVLNRAEISHLEPLSYIQELEGTVLALKTADLNGIYELLIITDNLVRGLYLFKYHDQ